MLGIQKIASIEEYNAAPKKYCDKCESYEWNHIIYFKNRGKYLLCNGCVRFFIFLKNKEMDGIMTGFLSLCSSFPRAKFPQEIYCTIES